MSLSGMLVALVATGELCGGALAEDPASGYRPGWFDGSTFYLLASSHNDIAYLDDPRGTADFRSESLILPALELMRTDDSFCLDIETTLYLKEFLDRHPERLDEVRQRVRERRLSFGGRYTQFYEAVFGGEALARQMYFGRKWLKRTLGDGCDTHIVWDTDVPQRTLQSPQVFAKSGIRYLMIGRFPTPGIHRWESPDGSGVTFNTYLYASGWAPPAGKPTEQYVFDWLESQRPFFEAHRIPNFSAVTMSDYSCPGADLLETIRDYNAKAEAIEKQTGQRPPRMTMATAETALESIESAQPDLPVYRQDWPNPWGYHHQPSHERVVSEARRGYTALVNAERFALIASLLDPESRPYPQQALTEGWEGLIYPDHGWCGERTLETLRVFYERFRRASDAGQHVQDASLNYIAGRIGRDKSAGPAIVVFNPLSWARTGPVTLAVKFHRGEVRPDALGLADRRGKPVACEWTVDTRYEDGSVRDASVCFVAEDVPSIGYSTYYVAKTPRSRAGRRAYALRERVIESAFYRLELGDRGIRSLVDKETGREVFDTAKFEGNELFMLGVGTVPLFPFEYTFYPDNRQTETLEGLGKLRSPLEVDSVRAGDVKTVIGLSGEGEHVRVHQELTLYHAIKRLDLSTELWWDGTRKRELRLAFPVRQPPDAQISYDVPFGVVEVGRNEMGSTMPREVQNWVDVSDGQGGVTLGVGATCFHDIRDITTDPLAGPMIQPVLLCTLRDLELIGQGEHPWWTQPGYHRYDYALTTHPGTWRENWHFGWEFGNPLRPVLMRDEENADAVVDVYTDGDPPESATSRTRTHTYGTLPEEYSFCSIAPANLMVSTIKRAEDDDSVVVRYVDMLGEGGEAALQFFAPAISAQTTNLIEEEPRPLPASGQTLRLPSAPYSISTVKLLPQRRGAIEAASLPLVDSMEYVSQDAADAVWRRVASYRPLVLTGERNHTPGGHRSLASQRHMQFGYAALPAGTGIAVEVWFYDSGDLDAFGGVIVAQGAATDPRGTAEFGVFPSAQFGGHGGGSGAYTFYTGTGDWKRQDSGIARSPGWHKVMFRVGAAGTSVYYDGRLMGTNAGLTSVRRLYLGNPWGGTKPLWYDDVSVTPVE